MDSKIGQIGLFPERRLIDAEIEQGLLKAGFVIVPVRPTDQMIEAAYWASAAGKTEEIWEEMQNARPKL